MDFLCNKEHSLACYIDDFDMPAKSDFIDDYLHDRVIIQKFKGETTKTEFCPNMSINDHRMPEVTEYKHLKL